MNSGKLYILQYRPGEIIEMDPDGGNRRTLLGNLLGNVDGIVIDKKTRTLYWTNMGPAIGPGEGEFFQADGSIECIGLNGANRRTLVGHGLTVTPKQVAADFDAGLLYWGDREGMRVMRSNLDGSNVTVLVRNGVFPADSHDLMRHCVGIAIDPVNRYIYWTTPPQQIFFLVLSHTPRMIQQTAIHKMSFAYRSHRMPARGASSGLGLKFQRISNPRIARISNC